MIYIAGGIDDLNDSKNIKRYFDNKYASKKDVLIILGNVNSLWDWKERLKIGDWYFRPTIIFLDFIDTNDKKLESCRIETKFEEEMFYIDDDFYYVKSGSVINVNGLRFLCIGSMLKSLNEIEELKERISRNVEKNKGKVDYVLTSFSLIDSSNNDLLNNLVNFLKENIKYKKWYFSDSQVDKEIDDTYMSFDNEILEIERMYKGKRGIDKKYYYIDYQGAIHSDKRKTKLKDSDFPEWYYKGYMYYYSMKDIKDLAFYHPHWNHINKDAHIAVSFDNPIEKDENYAPIHRYDYGNEDFAYDTWRIELTDFIKGIEKYSKGIDTTKLKEKVNTLYDNYFNKEYRPYSIYFRPYQNVETVPEDENKYYYMNGNTILLAFEDIEKGNEYLEKVREEFPDAYIKEIRRADSVNDKQTD